MNCTHTWKMYTGLTESFEYCGLCDVKKGHEADNIIVKGDLLEKRKGYVPLPISVAFKEAWQCSDFFDSLKYSANPFMGLLKDTPGLAAWLPTTPLTVEERIHDVCCNSLKMSGTQPKLMFISCANFLSLQTSLRHKAAYECSPVDRGSVGGIRLAMLGGYLEVRPTMYLNDSQFISSDKIEVFNE